jgi:hypothetical protein
VGDTHPYERGYQAEVIQPLECSQHSAVRGAETA